jgi:hypothetical protein
MWIKKKDTQGRLSICMFQFGNSVKHFDLISHEVYATRSHPKHVLFTYVHARGEGGLWKWKILRTMSCKGMCRDLFQDSVPQFHKATWEESRLTKIRVNQIWQGKQEIDYRIWSKASWLGRDGMIILSRILLFILTANGFSPGGSGTTIRHNTQTTHITQNNITIKRNTVHKTTHTINTLHRMKIQQSQLQLYKVTLIKIIML